MPPNHPETESLRDLVRGLRTAAASIESIDHYVSTSAARVEMLRDVERDMTALSALLVTAREQAA